MIWLKLFCILYFVAISFAASVPEVEEIEDLEVLENLIMKIDDGERVKRSVDRGVT